MRPEKASDILLGITRARAKMHEYGVPEAFYNEISRSPAQLFDLTIGILGDVAASIVAGQSSNERLSETRGHLLFCARFFDSYFESQLNSSLDPYMHLLGSATYYLRDFPGSAAVVASRLPLVLPNLGISGLEDLLSWMLRAEFATVPPFDAIPYDEAREVASLMSSFSSSGANSGDLLAAIANLRRVVYDNGFAKELLFSDLIGAVAHKRHSNSTWSTLPRYSQLDTSIWAPALQQESYIHELWPAQRLLGEQGVYFGKSAVVQMPTSAGKTRAVDLIIRSAFYSGRTSLAIIVAPFRALCEEIRQSLSRAFSTDNISVEQLSDVQQPDFDLGMLLSGRKVLVMTPEKCLYLLRHNPELTEELGLVVYDEGHQFDTGRRGVTYELLLTSLKGAVSKDTQTVLISAVLNNAQVIADWLLGSGGLVVSGTDLLPTTRSLAFASWLDQLGRLEFAEATNPDNAEFFVPRVIQQETLGSFPREKTLRVFPERESTSVGLYLALKLATSGGVAVFVGTKVIATSMAAKTAEIYNRTFSIPPPSTHSNPLEVARLVYQHSANLGAQATATLAAECGVYSHHGSIPHGIRLAVEHGMKKGIIRVVICTSTLAQGVNLPIRYLIVTGSNQGTERIRTREFHNLLGRAGRSGMYTEGTVIFSDVKIFDGRHNKEEQWRWPLTRNLLDPKNSEECKSALLSVLDPVTTVDRRATLALPEASIVTANAEGAQGWRRLAKEIVANYSTYKFGQEDLFVQLALKAEVLSAVESFLMAHWPEDGVDVGSSMESLAASTLAHHLGTSDEQSRLAKLFNALAVNIVQKVPESSLRKVFSRSLFGLADNLDIQKWVIENADILISRQTTELLLTDIWPLFARYVGNGTFKRCVPADPLAELAQRWIAGQSFGELCGFLVSENCRIGTGKRPLRPRVEHVVEICENGFGFDGMLIAGAVAELLAIVRPEQTACIELIRHLQKRIKYGLPTDTSVVLYEMGFADRVIAQELAEALGKVESRAKAIRRLRIREKDAHSVLGKYPSYFLEVFHDLIA